MAKVVDEQDPTVYKVKCEYCGAVIEYGKKDIGWRPWFPKGYVYCPKCKKPIRHHEANKVE